jgi:hypothetical protein
MADDPALSYNYDADPRWLEHLEKLSLSSTEASNDAALLTLAKQSWYQHNVVCKCEVMSFGESLCLLLSCHQ